MVVKAVAGAGDSTHASHKRCSHYPMHNYLYRRIAHHSGSRRCLCTERQPMGCTVVWVAKLEARTVAATVVREASLVAL
eukprot:6554164-Prymnesium_polylepis.1